jgi:hypothetical protein
MRSIPHSWGDQVNLGALLGCELKTCTMCKKAYHYGTTLDDCDEDLGTLEVKALGRQEGWQQCLECKKVVQLASGCFHITFVFSF